MVIETHQPARRRGSLIFEVIMAMTILCIAVIPVGFSLIADSGQFRSNYRRAVAMEIVDGEIEILAAGAWRDFPEGTQSYQVHAAAAASLPPGRFLLTRHGNHFAWNGLQPGNRASAPSSGR